MCRKATYYSRYTAFVPPSPADWPVVTGSVYDNAFEQHGVPNADRNYAWITASLEPDVPFYGFDEEILAPTLADAPWYLGNKSMYTAGAADKMMYDATADSVEYWEDQIGGIGDDAKAYSYSVWLHPTAMDASTPIPAIWGNYSRWLQFTGGSYPSVIAARQGFSQYRPSAASISANVWTHVTVTCEGLGAVPDIYINGALSNGTAANPDSPPTSITTTALGLAGYFTGASVVYDFQWLYV